MILRAKTEGLIKTKDLTEKQILNTELNIKEMKDGTLLLNSKPQRLVFEMTSSCNLNCIMCGRNAANFKHTVFDKKWLSLFDDIVEHVEEVTLMGWGEPTMHPEFVEFLKWADKHGLRKYFCTNGMKLDELKHHIFEQQVDVIAISLDSSNAEDNEEIRRGANFNKIVSNLKDIVNEKKRLNTNLPYMNFVTALMKRNLHELPKIVKLAADIGLDEVKGVFLTVFDNNLLSESLYDSMNEVSEVFAESVEIAYKYGIKIKLPHLRGEDTAENEYHKPCFATWRDFFLGSDGYIRPCMSTSTKLCHISEKATFDEFWNSQQFIDFRRSVNDSNKMSDSCKNCYQSSFANWNNKSAFFQLGTDFSPKWDE